MFILMQSLLNTVCKRPAWQFSASAGLGVVIAASLFSGLQHVSWFEGLYWAVVTVTTVGYGDVVPHDVAARILAMATMLVVIPLLAAAFADWAAALTTHCVGRMRISRTCCSRTRSGAYWATCAIRRGSPLKGGVVDTLSWGHGS